MILKLLFLKIAITITMSDFKCFTKATILFSAFFAIFMLGGCQQHDSIESLKKVSHGNELTKNSEQLLLAIKKKNTSAIKKINQKISSYSEKKLQKNLQDDVQKKVFWINFYNAQVQIILGNDSTLYDDRNDFFSDKLIKIGKKELSLDDIEHGILRKSNFKYGLGLIRNPFSSDFVKSMAVDQLDYRIHFGLNCGAKSCPPIRIYEPENFHRQISNNAEIFLNKISQFDSNENILRTTALFQWFSGDFNGKKGIEKILKYYGVVPEQSENFEIEYQDYDWSLRLAYFVNSNQTAS